MNSQRHSNSNLDHFLGSMDGLGRSSHDKNHNNSSNVSLAVLQESPSRNCNLSSRKKDTCSLEELQNMEESSILRLLASGKPFRGPSSEYLAGPQQMQFRTSNLQPEVSSVGNQNSKTPGVSNFQSLLKKFDGAPGEPGDALMASKERIQTRNCDCEESVGLRQQLDLLKIRLAKLQKLEPEVEKLHHSYHDLVTSTKKRESLEKAMRQQLEIDKEKLMDENQRLRDQVESLASRLAQNESPSHLEEYYTQSLFKLQELDECRERQEIELAAQRATLDEQRNHINILEGALASAQEEARKRQQLLDRLQNSGQKMRPNSRPVLGKQSNLPSHNLALQQKVPVLMPESPLSSVAVRSPDNLDNCALTQHESSEDASSTAQHHDELEARIRNLENRLTNDTVTDKHAPQRSLHNRTRSLNSSVISSQNKNSMSGNDDVPTGHVICDRSERPKEVRSQLWEV